MYMGISISRERKYFFRGGFLKLGLVHIFKRLQICEDEALSIDKRTGLVVHIPVST